MSLCRAILPTSNQNEGGLDTAAHQVYPALVLTFAAVIGQPTLTAMNIVLAVSGKPKAYHYELQSLSSL